MAKLLQFSQRSIVYPKKTFFLLFFFVFLQNFYFILNAQTVKKDTLKINAIKGEAIEKEVTPNTVNAVTGRATGVHVENGQLQVRGQFPLYVVDGIPLPPEFIGGSGSVSNPLNWFNSTNLEKIEILNDDDAAIYGARGVNGVVLITTKKQYSSTLQVDAQVSAGVITPSKWYDFLSTDEYLDIRNKAFAADVAAGYNNVPSATNAYDILTWGNKHNTDWQKEYLNNTGKVTSALLNLSGGTGNTYFYITSDYYRATSVFLPQKGDGSTRTNNRILANHTALGGRLTINASLGYSTWNSKERGGQESDHERQQGMADESTFLNAAPNQPAYNPDGSLYWLPTEEGGFNAFVNPLRLKYSTADKKTTSLLGRGYIYFHFFKELEGQVNIGYTRTNADDVLQEENAYQNPYATNKTYQNRVVSNNSHSDLINFEPQLNFSKRVGYGTLSALLGITYQVYNKSAKEFEMRDFDVENLFRSYATAKDRYNATSGSYTRKYASVWSRVGYDFRDRYLLNITFRRDGSSKYARGHRYGNFFSFGGGYIFSKEEWIKEHLPFLNFGKIRASYGLTGNDEVAATLYYDLYSIRSASIYENQIGLYRSQVANPDFNWEKTRKASVALELSAFRDKLQLNIDVYRHRSNSMYGSAPLSSQSGLSSYMGNIPGALIQNQGIEIQAVAPLTFGNFEWFSTLTLTIPQYGYLLKFDDIDKAGYSNKYKVGFSTNTKRIYRFTGINPENGVPTVEDYNKDGNITTDDKQFLYDFDADFYGGIEQSFRYKGVRLDLFFYGEQRPHVKGFLWQNYSPVGTVGKNVLREFAQDYWTPENPNASRPGLTTTTSTAIGSAWNSHYTESDAILTTGSFIRLKNVSLSYDLPKSALDRLKAKQITIYAIGENLWIYTKSNLWDPETGYSIPQLRVLTAGVKVRF